MGLGQPGQSDHKTHPVFLVVLQVLLLYMEFRLSRTSRPRRAEGAHVAPGLAAWACGAGKVGRVPSGQHGGAALRDSVLESAMPVNRFGPSGYDPAWTCLTAPQSLPAFPKLRAPIRSLLHTPAPLGTCDAARESGPARRSTYPRTFSATGPDPDFVAFGRTTSSAYLTSSVFTPGVLAPELTYPMAPLVFAT